MSNAADAQRGSLPVPANVWLHGLLMLIVLVLVNVIQTGLGICALLQFLWMIFVRDRNVHIAAFGEQIANWLSTSAQFVTGASDQKPFPWTAWP